MTWQTLYVWFMRQFKQHQTFIRLSPFTSLLLLQTLSSYQRSSCFSFRHTVWIQLSICPVGVTYTQMLQDFCVSPTEINPCLEGNGGCHANADCVHVGPNKVKTDFNLCCKRASADTFVFVHDVTSFNSLSDFLFLQWRLLRWRAELQDDQLVSKSKCVSWLSENHGFDKDSLLKENDLVLIQEVLVTACHSKHLIERVCL